MRTPRHRSVEKDSFMHMFQGHKRNQPDGRLSIYRVARGFYGVPTAARGFSKLLREKLDTTGAKRLMSARTMFRLAGDGAHLGERVVGGTIVDNILMEGPKHMLNYMLDSISKAFNGDITHEFDPTAFGGYALRRDWSAGTITLAVPEKIFALAAMLNVSHDPKINKKLYGPPAVTREDMEAMGFDKRTGKLDEDQKLVQRADGLGQWIGELRYDEKMYFQEVAKYMSRPLAAPALKILRAVARALIETPFRGVTFGGMKSTATLETVHSSKDMRELPTRVFDIDRAGIDYAQVFDATWGSLSNASIVAEAHIFNNAAFAVHVKNVPGTPMSSTQAEAYVQAGSMARGKGYYHQMIEMDIPVVLPIGVGRQHVCRDAR